MPTIESHIGAILVSKLRGFLWRRCLGVFTFARLARGLEDCVFEKGRDAV